MAVNWDTNLEELHEEASRTHFIDVWTRRAMIDQLGALSPGSSVLDLGCSTGYLLEDLAVAAPQNRLAGLDGVYAGLARSVAPAGLVQGDACHLPFANRSFDAIVSANLLEHVEDDEAALDEIWRCLRPGGRAVLVVPHGPGVYDYYDRYLRHVRRYARGELAKRAQRVGFVVVRDVHLGSVMYPAFWALKKANRARFDKLSGEALAQKVAADIAHTKDSRLGSVMCALERVLLERHLELPFGIRGLTVLVRPAGR